EAVGLLAAAVVRLERALHRVSRSGKPADRPARRSIATRIDAGQRARCGKGRQKGVCAFRPRKPRCYTPRRFRGGPQLPFPAVAVRPLPKGFHTCGKVLWIRMAVTSVEQAAQGVWARVTEKARGELPESSYGMWFSEVRPASLEGDVLQLAVPSEYVREWLVRHYLPLIQTAASESA